MIRNLTLLATTAAIVIVPQIAQAGCSGNACGAVAGTTNYSASDKRVRATVKNQDQSNPIHLKFCVNVDYHCNGFEATLAAHETITRDVPFTGAKPPQIHAVDVVTAEFPAQRASSGSGAPGASGGAAPGAAAPGAAVAIDTPRGKVMCLAARQSVVAPLLTKAATSFRTVDDNFSEGQQHAEKMHELSDKIGSMKDVEGEIAVMKNKKGGKAMRDEAHIAKQAELALSNYASIFKLAESSAEYAAANFKISEDDLRGAQDAERARQLRADAEKAQSGLNGLFKAINFAADSVIAASISQDPAGRVNSLVANVQKVFELFGGNPWLDEAEKLEARASQIHADGAEKKFIAAKSYMTSLKQQVASLQSKFPDFQSNLQTTRETAEQSYDEIAKAQKSGNNFNFERLQQAIDESQRTINYARRVAEAAYGTRDALKQLSQAAGNDGNWMAFPGEGRNILNRMDSEANAAFNWGVKERQSAEALLKKFNDMYTTAHAASQ